MVTFKAGGRELALAFTLAAMDRMEDRLGCPVDLRDIKAIVAEATQDRRKCVTLLQTLAEEGEACGGPEAPDEMWLKRHLRAGDLPRMQIAIFEAVSEGMTMETGEGDESEEVDVVLESLKKKAETAG